MKPTELKAAAPHEFLDVSVTDLKAAEYNPRRMKRDEFLNLKESIRTFGFTQPITINKDHTVIAGHQRLAAAIELGLAHVPCFRIDVSKDQERVLNVAMNRIQGDFDEDKLRALLEQVSCEELHLTGMSDKDLAAVLAQEPEAEEKDAAFDLHPDRNERGGGVHH